MKWNNKSKLIWLFLLTIIPNTIFSQVVWDSTARPAVYESCVGVFQSLDQSKKDIIFLGNSITFWGKWSEMLGMSHVKNRGIPGDITFGMLEFLDDIIKGKPAKVFIMIGINDLAKGIPDSIILQNYKRIIHRIKTGSSSTKIYFQTLLPTNDTFGGMTNHCNKKSHILHINTVLKEMADTEGIVVIDLYPYFINEFGKMKEEYTWDGVHLTAEGYKQWVKVLKSGKYIK